MEASQIHNRTLMSLIDHFLAAAVALDGSCFSLASSFLCYGSMVHMYSTNLLGSMTHERDQGSLHVQSPLWRAPLEPLLPVLWFYCSSFYRVEMCSRATPENGLLYKDIGSGVRQCSGL